MAVEVGYKNPVPVLSDLARIFRVVPSLETINLQVKYGSDPGWSWVYVRRKGMAGTTLADYHELEARAVELAEKVMRGRDWVAEVEEKLPRMAGDRAAEYRKRLPGAVEQLTAWERDLEACEDTMVACWREYLRAQPGGQRVLYSERTGSRHVLSCKPLWDCEDPVWMPEDICLLLRVARTFDPETLDLSGPEKFLAEYGDKDPVYRAVRPKKRPLVRRRPNQPQATLIEVDGLSSPTLGQL